MLLTRQITVSFMVISIITSQLSAQSVGDWMPVVSKIKRTVHRIPNGGVSEEVETWNGQFYRSSNGSQMQTIKQISPGPSEVSASFIDRTTGKAYQLDYSTNTAVLSQDNIRGRGDKLSERKKLVSLGREETTFLGTPCFVIPVTSPDPSVSGHGCYSPEYDLHLYLEIDFTDSFGVKIRHRTEHYDLDIGRIPDRENVQIPDSFVIQEGMCADCSISGTSLDIDP